VLVALLFQPYVEVLQSRANHLGGRSQSRKATSHRSNVALASPNECVSTESLPNCTKAKAIGSAVGVAISPDGVNVYASSAGESAVAAAVLKPVGTK
jgi:hypothetical protein